MRGRNHRLRAHAAFDWGIAVALLPETGLTLPTETPIAAWREAPLCETDLYQFGHEHWGEVWTIWSTRLAAGAKGILNLEAGVTG